MTEFDEPTDALESKLRGVLGELGLNEYEKTAYLMILQNGVTVARDISEHTKIPYAKVYQVLDSLIDKGLLEGDEGRPKRFHTKPPKEAIYTLLQNIENQLRLEQNKRINLVSDTINDFNKLYDSRKNFIQEKQGVWTISGLINIQNRIEQLLQRTENEVLIITKSYHPIIGKITNYIRSTSEKSHVKIQIQTMEDQVELFDMDSNITKIEFHGDSIMIFFDDFANLNIVNGNQKETEIGILTQMDNIVKSLLEFNKNKVGVNYNE